MQFHEHKPIYLQIADFVIDKILKKEFSPGDRIPSVRELAVLTEVTPNTVMRTFQFMQDRNLIFNKRGIGYFVSDEAPEIAKQMKLDEFVNEQLPEIFKQMEILNLNFDNLKEFYNNFKTQKNEKENK